MKEGPLFSFVMPAYKAEFLKESIDSILGQTYANLELIVVDDCSPLALEGIVRRYSDERVTYCSNEENIGGRDLIAQWNHCLSYAKGEWVILATDDDIYESTFLETFLKMHSEHPDVDLFRGRICWIDEKSDITYIERCYERCLSPVHFFYEMMDGMKGGIPQYIFRRATLIKKAGFVNFPKAWGSDDATAIMMSENGVLFSEQPLVSFRWSGHNISTMGKYGLEKVQARIQYSKWMIEHQPNKSETDKFENFYFNQIEERLLTMIKVHLLIHIKAIPYCKRVVYMSSWLKQLNIFGWKDKMSIVGRSLLIDK